MLRHRTWRLKYTPDKCDLVEEFYIPALASAVRYDRLTGFFNARALTLAARGIVGLVHNKGRMRLVVGCTLEQPEIEAIREGEQLRDLVERHLANNPLNPPSSSSSDALELLAWMVAQEHLDIKVAVPCDSRRQPIPSAGIFHEKAGVIRDGSGDRIAWNGSLNETAAGWTENWESINVYRSWESDHERVQQEEANFDRIWSDKASRLIVLDIPESLHRDLMRFLPEDDRPARLKRKPPPPADLRDRIWSFIEQAPSLSPSGDAVAEETSAVSLWPHQAAALQRLFANWPPKLLIADEVGLGKTIQAGMLLRRAWLARRIRRVLILAPKAVLKQWQVELWEKFNLNWPIYDGRKLTFYPSPAVGTHRNRIVGRNEWHQERAVIASSHLVRRKDRARDLLRQAESWDLIVLDEAHHARRKGSGDLRRDRPNMLLRLMRDLKGRTDGLLLLTATPMQIHPIEVWDLLSLFDLPPEWTSAAFLQFLEDISLSDPSDLARKRMAKMFQSAEGAYGELDTQVAMRISKLSRLQTKRVLRALRSESSISLRRLSGAKLQAAIRVLSASSPIRRLISRHTRELLRRYVQDGLLDQPIATRRVKDCFLKLSPDERAIYTAVEDYIATTYQRATSKERSAVGFVMTIYRRRLASSFAALRSTLEKRLKALQSDRPSSLEGSEEDLPDDELLDEALDTDKQTRCEQLALQAEEAGSIESIVERVRRLPPDSKFKRLERVLASLREQGYGQAMVFTQYTDTMDFLRERLRICPDLKLMCFSGRGGEVPTHDGYWHAISREAAKRRFRGRAADVLLCTDAAAEGLNFQFCGALINYDMPWNPMRVEQRIGRLDRIGQKFQHIRIVNLHYRDTVEADVYKALRSRIGLFESVVGQLQPILSKLSGSIKKAVLSGDARREETRTAVANEIERQASQAEEGGFDLDAFSSDDLQKSTSPPSPITMDDLDRIIRTPELMPDDFRAEPLGSKEYKLTGPDMAGSVRVTTDPEYFDKHSDSLELWSPGNPLFVPPRLSGHRSPPSGATALKDLLDS